MAALSATPFQNPIPSTVDPPPVDGSEFPPYSAEAFGFASDAADDENDGSPSLNSDLGLGPADFLPESPMAEEQPLSPPRSPPSSPSHLLVALPFRSSETLGPPSLLHLSFNQDYGCFAVGTDRGFHIHNCDPFREIFRRDFDGGGIGVVEMLFRCNILALVGGGPHPQYPPTRVMIWDDHQSRCIGELTFRSEVRAVRLRRDRIIVVLDQKIFVYNFVDLKLLHQIETVPNPKGLCTVSQHQGSLVLVCPGGQKGQIRVEHYGTRRTKFIMAHESRIACFALSHDGRLIATASSKGTLIRVFSTADGTLLQEVRRGADRAEIYSLAFSGDMQWLAASSDKGTVHVFTLKVNVGATVNDRPRPMADLNTANSSLSLIKGVLPKYFKSEWSVAQFRLHEGSQYIVAFGHQKYTVVVLGMDGSFYRCQFDPAAGGEMSQLECHNFLNPDKI